MKGKLLFLNLTLFLALVAAGAKIREEWLLAKARRESLQPQSVPAVKKAPPAPAEAPPSPALTAAPYLDVAQRVLFFRDRNSQVIVEVPEKPKPKPLPPLPLLLGTMNLGDGVTLMMAEKQGARPKALHIGERIGEYKLAAIEEDVLVLEWEEGPVRKRFEELIAKPAAAAESAGGATARTTGVNVHALPAPAPPKPVAAAPGVEMAPGVRACVPGDSSAPGTVVDGMRKVVSATPFGNYCRWEPVK